MNIVLKYLDDALTELDSMDSIISSYKIHLNVRNTVYNVDVETHVEHVQAVSDDITYIQSQDRGLQVQTQNQRALLGELEELLASHTCTWVFCLQLI